MIDHTDLAPTLKGKDPLRSDTREGGDEIH